MRSLLSIVTAFGALLAASSTQAQDRTEEEAIRAVHGRAACIVYQSSSTVGEIVSVPPGSRAERTLFRRLVPGCTGTGFQMEVPGQLLRGALIEQVLRLGDGNRSDGMRMRWFAPFTGLTAADIAALDDRGRLALGALDLAQCVQAAAPDAVQALLDTPPTYSGERDAFRQLAPLLGPCLQEGARLTVSMPQLRGFLAEAAYRAAYAASRTSASPSNE